MKKATGKKALIRRVIVILLFTGPAVGSLSLSAQKSVPVFISGTEGYKTFRIPAILPAPDGSLLAFCEGRVNGDNDFGNIDIVMKRSRDGGKSWSPLQVVADNDSLLAGNPAPVVDYRDPAFPRGRIFLFYNTARNSEGEVRKGIGCREVWYKTSSDAGKTWSAPVNITLEVSRPNEPSFNPAYHFSEDWRWYANTPGHAIQLEAGKYRGRIYVAANHSLPLKESDREDVFSHGFYSDDHGKSFHLSASVPIAGSNEAMAVELPGNGLMMNTRNQNAVRARIVAISSNGGMTWDTAYYDRQLPDPACQGSILGIKGKGGKERLVFCNAATRTRRDSLTLRVSDDLGKTWPNAICIDQDPSQLSNTAYSDLVEMPDHRVGVLYESDWYSKIVFVVVNLKGMRVDG